jgi:hypothetical protein
MLRRLLFKNILLKLLALTLSAALWVAITGDEFIIQRAIDAPLEFKNVPSGFGIHCEEGKSVEVLLRGSSSLIREISDQDVSVGVNALELGEGTNTVTLSSGNVRHPFGLEVVRVLPAQLRVELFRASKQ